MRMVDAPRAVSVLDHDSNDRVLFSGCVVRVVAQDTASFSDEFRDWLFGVQDGECGYCGCDLGDTWNGNPGAHVEHIKPRRLGGEDLPPNIMYACRSCNTSKGMDHFSSLLIKRALKKSGLDEVISWRVASRLLAMGVLNLQIEPSFHFERRGWLHVHSLPCPLEHQAIYTEKFPGRAAKRIDFVDKEDLLHG